jgi:hypothetical protein
VRVRVRVRVYDIYIRYIYIINVFMYLQECIGAALCSVQAWPGGGGRGGGGDDKRRAASENMHPNILRTGFNSWNDKGSADETLREKAVRVTGPHELSVRTQPLGHELGATQPFARVTHGGRKALVALGGAVKDGGGGNRSMQGLLDRAHALLARGDQRL